MIKDIELRAGNKRAVILFHGLTGTPFELSRFAKYFLSLKFDVFVPCLPGHCTKPSALDRVAWQDWSYFAQDKYKMISNKYNEVFISGICLGALLCLEISRRFSVKAQALLSPTLAIDGWNIPWYRFLLPLAFIPPFIWFYSYKESEPYGIKNESVRRQVLRIMQNKSSGVYENYSAIAIRELLRFSKSVKLYLKEIKTPTLVIHSTQDDLCNIKNARDLYNRLSSKDKKFVELHDSYHMVTLDNERDMVFKECSDFFIKYSEVVDEQDSQI
ncbi:carboxylesterase [Thermodesulfobium acidiphilum]|uniref:Carboxylesterase n=1 Tax=Thermodesulfobium acidiphilum TaxID=1794699 RepID=A0A2R4VYE4_THEAF|nr:alpha/beta fold hydrolase [Thermodesulfobium acidiphilum]AWB09535.1 carboxylesterase [Thermodesulfobium acidiphilum]